METAAEGRTSVENTSTPFWLTLLFMEIFFEECTKHLNDKKNECNFYCIDCRESLCSNCLNPHLEHKFIQIRKYMYRNVVNVQDIRKFFNCSGVQTYTTNNNRVVLLTQKESPIKNQPSSKNFCLHCGRSLPETLLYCCLECKASVIYGKGSQTEDIGETSSARANINSGDVSDDADEIGASAELPKPKQGRKQQKPFRSPLN